MVSRVLRQVAGRVPAVAILVAIVSGPDLASATVLPSVEEQLRADGVVPGTALERAVRANQDVELLGGEGDQDASEYPVWVRVLWRKMLGVRRGNPGLLGQIYRWMLANPDRAGRVLAELEVYGRWPDLAKQRNQEGVRDGTRLAELMAENQELWLLREDESSDTRGIPLWLRVAWRKAHPEMASWPDDATGGYPRVLKDVAAWLCAHQDHGWEQPAVEQQNDDTAAWTPGGQIDDDVPAIGAATVQWRKKISDGVSAPRSGSDIRVNPWNAQKLLAAANRLGAGETQQGQYRSTDGGTTWALALLPLAGGDSLQADPSVDWTSDGQAWTTTVGVEGAIATRARAYRSLDGGASWVYDGLVSGSQTDADKPVLWADHSAVSRFKDRQYATWRGGKYLYFNRRAADGWLAPLRVSGEETLGAAIGGDVKTNARGDVFVFWADAKYTQAGHAEDKGRGVYVNRSYDGGATFGVPVRIAQTLDTYDIGIPAFANRRSLMYVSGGAYYAGPGQDYVFAVWTDLKGGPSCNKPSHEPGTNITSPCTTSIRFGRSTSGGATGWTLSDSGLKPPSLASQDQFNPRLAVDDKTGTLTVTYYESTTADRKRTTLRYTFSTDFGQTWSTAEDVKGESTDETVDGASQVLQYGDYNGLSGYNGVFHPTWTDRSGNQKEEIWAAKIVTDAPGCTVPGAPTGVSANASAPNTLTVSWQQASPMAETFNIYKATVASPCSGTCPADPSYSLMATGVHGTGYKDLDVQAGVAYSYKVSGADVTRGCESARSTSCGCATATGKSCVKAPVFAGVSTVTPTANSECSMLVSWGAASSQCGASVTYHVYRSTQPTFWPDQRTRVAAGLTGTSYTDDSGLQCGTVYYYIVRARDSVSERMDTNRVAIGGSPRGTTSTATWMGSITDLGWTHGRNQGSDDWRTVEAPGTSPATFWSAADVATVADKWVATPPLNLTASSVLTFSHRYDFEVKDADTGYDGGILEVSTNGGSSWSAIPEASITSGGYNRTIETLSFPDTNPLWGKRAWSGAQPSFGGVAVNLAAYAGSGVQVRWRLGSDGSMGKGTWDIGNVQVTNVQLAPCTTKPVGVVGRSLEVDWKADGITPTPPNANGLLEPGEEVHVAPTWLNGSATAYTNVTGVASNFTGPPGATYELLDYQASYGSLAIGAQTDCKASGYRIRVNAPPTRPATHWDASFQEDLNSNGTTIATRTWTIHIGNSFPLDVPPSDGGYKFVETVLHNGLTAGCAPGSYCPQTSTSRAMMAVFLLVARHGSDYGCSPPTGALFADVPGVHWAAAWIEQLTREEIGGGCSLQPPLCPASAGFGPDLPLTRAEMGEWMLRAKYGPEYVPPPATGEFSDVPLGHGAAPWVDELKREGLTAGCDIGRYCPHNPVTRWEMAVFLVSAFDLRLDE